MDQQRCGLKRMNRSRFGGEKRSGLWIAIVVVNARSASIKQQSGGASGVIMLGRRSDRHIDSFDSIINP
jgi:hypothetical protein